MKVIIPLVLILFFNSSFSQPRDEASIFFVGHSLVNLDMPDMVHSLALNAGLINSIDLQVINGSPLRYNWQNSHDAQGSDARVVLPQGNFNTFVMTEAIPADIDMIQYGGLFFDLAQTSHASMQTYYYETWHWLTWGIGDAEAIDWFNDFETNPNFHFPTPESNYSFRSQIDISAPMWVQRVEAINADYPQHTPMLIIPAGTALGQLYDAIQAGSVPGVSQIDEIFADNIHMNDIGNYFVALVQYATIYRRSPVGLSNQLTNIYGVDFNPPTPAQAAFFQQLVWDVVQNYPHSGVIVETTDLIFSSGFEN